MKRRKEQRVDPVSGNIYPKMIYDPDENETAAMVSCFLMVVVSCRCCLWGALVIVVGEEWRQEKVISTRPSKVQDLS